MGWHAKLSLLLVLSIGLTHKVHAQNTGFWYHSYVSADAPDEVSTCNVNFDFSNAWFTARIYDEYLDFIYYRQDFTLPYGEALGGVLLKIDQATFFVTASTNARRADETIPTSQVLFMVAATDDYEGIISAFRYGRTLTIQFPNGSRYEFPLTGSDRAFSQAMQCWLDKPTGPFSNNPFAAPSASNNPFSAN